MMGLIGQGCEHGDVLEVTGTNTPTQNNTPSVFHVWAIEKSSNAPRIICLPQKNEEMIVVFVFVVQCLTQHAACTLLGCGGGCCFMGLCWWF